MVRRLLYSIGKIEILSAQIKPFSADHEFNLLFLMQYVTVLQSECRSNIRRKYLFHSIEVYRFAVLRYVEGFILGVCISEIIVSLQPVYRRCRQFQFNTFTRKFSGV